MVSVNLLAMGESRGWNPHLVRKSRKILIPATNYILIKQRRRRGFRATIFRDQTPQQVARKLKLRHERMILMLLGSLFIPGGQAFERGPQFDSLVNHVALSPGLMSLANLFLYPQQSNAGAPTVPKFFAISEINAHGPTDSHVSIT